LSTFYPEAKQIDDREVLERQVVRLVAKVATLAACAYRFSVGMPFVYPDNSLDFSGNFLSMMWKIAEARYDANPVLAKALDVLFILHADHEQNCSTTAMRTVASSHSDPYSATAAATAALYGPRHGGRQRGGAEDAGRDRLHGQRPGLHRGRQGRQGQAPGLRSPGLQELRPRAKIVKRTADAVFEVTGKSPLLDIALKLEEVALSDDYFISRKLYPNVDFYSGLIYQAMGFPMDMFTVLFHHPPHVGLAGPLHRTARSGRPHRPAPPRPTSATRSATTSPSPSGSDPRSRCGFRDTCGGIRTQMGVR